MYDGMLVGGWHMCFYFIGVVLFGNFLILNLFIAILMSSFESQSERNRMIERAQKMLLDESAKEKLKHPEDRSEKDQIKREKSNLTNVYK